MRDATTMKRFLAILFCLIGVMVTSNAQDVATLEKIGAVTGFTRNERSITLNCQDQSQVQLVILAPDLIRVRASFAKALPAKDHSWAIAKDDWIVPRWQLNETADSIIVATDEVEVVVHRSPLLIDFRDAR